MPGFPATELLAGTDLLIDAVYRVNPFYFIDGEIEIRKAGLIATKCVHPLDRSENTNLPSGELKESTLPSYTGTPAFLSASSLCKSNSSLFRQSYRCAHRY